MSFAGSLVITCGLVLVVASNAMGEPPAVFTGVGGAGVDALRRLQEQIDAVTAERTTLNGQITPLTTQRTTLLEEIRRLSTNPDGSPRTLEPGSADATRLAAAQGELGGIVARLQPLETQRIALDTRLAELERQKLEAQAQLTPPQPQQPTVLVDQRTQIFNPPQQPQQKKNQNENPKVVVVNGGGAPLQAPPPGGAGGGGAPSGTGGGGGTGGGAPMASAPAASPGGGANAATVASAASPITPPTPVNTGTLGSASTTPPKSGGTQTASTSPTTSGTTPGTNFGISTRALNKATGILDLRPRITAANIIPQTSASLRRSAPSRLVASAMTSGGSGQRMATGAEPERGVADEKPTEKPTEKAIEKPAEAKQAGRSTRFMNFGGGGDSSPSSGAAGSNDVATMGIKFGGHGQQGM